MAIPTGDTAVISPGHDACVIGNEQMVGVDLLDLKTMQRKEAHKHSSRPSRKGEE